MGYFKDSTKLSPYLALGILSPNQIYHEIKRFESEIEANESTYWVIFELLWREYFRWIALKWKAQFYTGMHAPTHNYKLPHNSKILFEQWSQGRTGNDFIDANMIELNQTGWMSNRGRQNVASYLIHDLMLPWTWGAQYFECHLLDYDPNSNWGNWSYLAGVGQDPRARKFNIEKQAEQYDPEYLYRNRWLQVKRF